LNTPIGLTVSVIVGLVLGMTEKEVRVALEAKSGLAEMTSVEVSAIDFGASTFPPASVAIL
jgi:hypothetical protein